MYRWKMALNNLQGLICHKTQPTNLLGRCIIGFSHLQGFFHLLLILFSRGFCGFRGEVAYFIHFPKFFYLSFCSFSLEASILFFWILSIGLKRVIDFFFYLCCENFPRHRLTHYESIQIYLFHLGIYLVAEPVCRGWTLIFLNQNPCMTSWSDVYQFDTFFSVPLNEFKCISVLGSSPRLCNSFSYYLSIWPFCYVFSIPIFYANSFPFTWWFVQMLSPTISL